MSDDSNANEHQAASERIRVDPDSPDAEVLSRAAAVLRAGGLVAFPTETVYGLGANALDPTAIRSVFKAKERPSTDPLIVHVASVEQAESLTSRWTPGAAALAKEFWPGPLTLVLPKSESISDEITAGKSTVALRFPAHPVARALIEAAGVPVAAPSANKFGRVSPTTADHVVSELQGSYRILLDAGPATVGVESSVVDLSGELPVLLRPGGVTLEDLRRVLPGIDHMERRSNAEEVPSDAPGQFLRHYAPTTPLVLVESVEGLERSERSTELLQALESQLGHRGVRAMVLELGDDPRAAAKCLYAQLRAADMSGAALILAPVMGDAGLGRAVNDRLFRAAHGRVVTGSDPGTLDALAKLASSERS